MNGTADPLGLATNIEIKAPKEPSKTTDDNSDGHSISNSDKEQIEMICERAKS